MAIKAHVTTERLTAWESEEGADAPTLGQLRPLAAKYHFPVAVFYLPEPPKDFAPLRDRRRLTGVEKEPISANLALQIRNAYERRKLALELFADLRSSPKPISLTANVGDNPEQVGAAIRRFSRVDNNDQKRAARQARAFDYWRQRVEDDDVLVFVVSGPHHSRRTERNARVCYRHARAAGDRRQRKGLQPPRKSVHPDPRAVPRSAR
jgi:hypothetical protein